MLSLFVCHVAFLAHGIFSASDALSMARARLSDQRGMVSSGDIVRVALAARTVRHACETHAVVAVVRQDGNMAFVKLLENNTHQIIASLVDENGRLGIFRDMFAWHVRTLAPAILTAKDQPSHNALE